MHDDIPEKPEDFFGPGCGCLALILVTVATSCVALWGLFELARAVARWILE
jgi:hypothetical protein